MRRMRIVLPILLLGFIFILGLMLTNPSQANNDPSWLPFDGNSTPATPSLSLLSASPVGITFNAGLPGVYAETVTAAGVSFTRLSGDGYGAPGAYGLPDLPVLRREVEIPFGAQVSVKISSVKFTDHSLQALGLNPIYPLQSPVPKVEGVEDNQPFTIDSKYYEHGSAYPSAVVSIGEPYIVRGHRIVQVEVWPVAYDPSKASLRLYSEVLFNLTLSGSDMATTARLADRYASPAFDPSLSQRVLNYNQGHPIRVNSQTGYLMISADAYAGAVQPLISLRENRGFDVTLTLTSQIPGGPTTANIKAYIQTAYDTWPLPPSYVLLVGDTDTVPTFTGPEIGTSTDLYFATMDGSEDWHPDVGRGRFPVRSVADTAVMVEKYLEYATLTGQEEWIKAASFPATCDRYEVAEGTHNDVIDRHTGPGGWIGHFPTDPTVGGDKLYCITYGANEADVMEMATQGRWAIIYSGHGNYDGWELLSQVNVANINNNGMYPFVASHACLTGDFGMPEVFGETWVLQEGKGALVYWGSSTYSYWDEDDVLERAMFDSLFADPIPPADFHADVTAMTYAGLADVELHFSSSAKYYWETYNILGDPAVRLFMEPDQPGFTLNLAPSSQEVCTEGSLASTVEIGSVMGYSATVSLEYGELPVNVTANFDPAEAPAPYTSTLTVDIAAGALEGDYTIPITATDHVSQTLDTDFNLRINTGTPGVPELLSPADGAADQPFTPVFDWSDLLLVKGYNFELAKSPLFESPVITATGLLTSDFTSPALDGGTCYWWQAQAGNACGVGAWAQPFHFSTVNLGVAFFDDMESGAGQWSHFAAPGTDNWVISSDASHSPSQSWFVPDDGAITDSRLWTTAPIQLGTGSTLTFWHQYQFEGSDPYAFDGSVLEISTDLGESWNDLGTYFTSNGYNGTIYTGYNNPLSGRLGWTGDLTDLTEVTVDLGSFAGQQVMLRWRIGCDSSVSDVGWYIDDVQITAPLPTNPAPILVSITPNSGANDVPTPVVITGTGFTGSPALKLGDTWLEAVTLVETDTLTAVVPAGLPIGTYDLAIFNGDCQTGVLEDAFTVTAGDEPITGLVALNDGPTVLGETTTLSATIEAGTNVTYDWDFGDGVTAEGQVVTHPYASEGIFTATVTACNLAGCVQATTEVTILPVPVIHPVYLSLIHR